VLIVPFGVRAADDGLPVLRMTAGKRAPTAFFTIFSSLPPVEDVLFGEGKILGRTDGI
jgi:hypothetical protein